MDIIIEDNGDLKATGDLPKVLVELPPELISWVNQNQDLIRRVQRSLSETYHTLTEDELWEIIAENAAHEWRQARQTLTVQEARVREMERPEGVPLGLIGTALCSEELNEVEGSYIVSLANFTVIDEGLRKRPDLMNLLNVLMTQKRMLTASTQMTQQALHATAGLSNVMNAAAQTEFFKQRRATDKNRDGWLRRQFSSLRKRAGDNSRDASLRRKFAARACRTMPSRKTIDVPRSVPVPWSPQT